MNNKRHDHGGDTRAQKERGATPSESAPHGTTDTADCTKPFNPLRIALSAPLALDLLLLAVAALLLIGGAA
jgi:hypothetical protein